MTTNAMPDTGRNAEEAEAKRRAIADARAEIAAGKGIPNDKITKWLDSWGKPDELPPPSKWK